MVDPKWWDPLGEVDCFIDCRDQPPDMTEDEQPDNGQGDPGDSALS